MSEAEAVQLEDLPLLQFMSPDVRRVVSASFVPVDHPFGSVIVAEGEPSDAVYAVLAGRVRVVASGDDGAEVTLATLGPGYTFGEVGLLRATPRTATVRASTPVRLARLDATVFQALVDTDERIRSDLEVHVRRVQLANFLRLHSRFADLPGDVLASFLRALEPVALPAGTVVVREGEPPGPLYVVKDGRLRAWTGTARAPRDVAYLRPGDVFGERAAVTGEPSACTVETLTDTRLLRLPVRELERLLDEPAFRGAVEELVDSYRYRSLARVPLDFADEILPAGASTVTTARDAAGADRSAGVDEDAPAYQPPAERPARRRIRRFSHVFQVDAADCGAACLAMVMRHFGRPVSLARAREVSRTTIEGASMAGIADGAELLGLEARKLKVSKRNLDDLPLPAICHYDGNHWVVVHDVHGDRVRLSDPAVGRRRLRRADLEARWTGYTVVVAPTPRLDDVSPAPRPGAWLLPFVRRHARRFAGAVLLALAVAGLELLIPVFSQVVVDRVLPGSDLDLLRTLLIGLAVTAAAISAASFANRYLLSRVAVRVDAEALDHLAARLLALPLRYFQTRRTGDVQRRLAALRQVRSVVVQNGVLAVTAAAQLLVAVALMFGYSRPLATVFVAVVPVYGLLMVFARRRIRPLADNLEESFARYHSRQVDALRGIETVKAMGAEETLRDALVRDFDELAGRQFKSDLAGMSYEAGVQVVNFLSLGAFLWAGAVQVLDGRLSVGGFVAFNALVALAATALRILLFVWDDLQVAEILLDRLNDIFEEEPEQGHEREGLRDVPSLAGHVAVRSLTVRYGGAEAPPILADVDLEVPAGTRVAIVGRSGSGKTTLVRALAGLLEPVSGRVLFDGVDAATLDRRQLRRHLGFLPQETFLFADTIAANIAFGEPAPDPDRVAWAARVADAHDFIVRLPLGYDTRVGETGLLLSGGQRQRIALARAAYRRPAVLILDEATSNLDAESERAVQDNLDGLLEGVTSFVVAHRLSTIRHADVIVVLERGRIVERGTHDELMARRGIYFYLASQQLEL